MYFYNDTGSAITISNVSFHVATAASGTGAAAAFNIYKSSGNPAEGLDANAIALFASAIDLGTTNNSSTNVPAITTVEAGRWVSVRCTSSAGATSKAQNAQIIITYA